MKNILFIAIGLIMGISFSAFAQDLEGVDIVPDGSALITPEPKGSSTLEIALSDTQKFILKQDRTLKGDEATQYNFARVLEMLKFLEKKCSR